MEAPETVCFIVKAVCLSVSGLQVLDSGSAEAVCLPISDNQ